MRKKAGYERFWDMPLGGMSGKRDVPHLVGNLIWAFLVLVFKLCFRYRVDKRENLRGFKNECGVLVVANHTSFLDVAFMYQAARPSQWIRFMGREDLFPAAHGLVGHILSRVGAFPVKRDAADRSAIKRAARMLKDGEAVGILPEGTRRGKSDRQPELHSGASFVAKMGRAPILPMTVRNAEHVKQKGRFFRFPKITIEYGEPLLVGDFDFLPKEDRLDGCTWYAMRECFALSLRLPREEVDMPALFPTGRDFTAAFAGREMPARSTASIVAGMRAARAAAQAEAGMHGGSAAAQAEAGMHGGSAAAPVAADTEDKRAAAQAAADTDDARQAPLTGRAAPSHIRGQAEQAAATLASPAEGLPGKDMR